MMKDPWFRGLDLITGPDGQVWMNDWSDTGECHDNDGIHRSSGRIYRIVYDGPDKGTPTPKRPAWLTQRAEGPSPWENPANFWPPDDESQRAMAVRWLAEDKERSIESRISAACQTDRPARPPRACRSAAATAS